MTDTKVQILERAAQLGGPIPNLSDGDLFKIPRYEEEFVSERFPALNGKVAMRYPAFGDEVEIERLASIMGGSVLARTNAAIVVCLEAAPATWFRPGQGGNIQPVVAVERIPDSPALVRLVGRWIAWRDDFRSPDAHSADGASIGEPAASLGRG